MTELPMLLIIVKTSIIELREHAFFITLSVSRCSCSLNGHLTPLRFEFEAISIEQRIIAEAGVLMTGHALLRTLNHL